MENQHENTKRVCRTCAYVKPNGSGFYRGSGPTCGSYIGPKAGKMIALDETTCSKHETPVESRASRIVHTSIDCAKSGIERASTEVLILARRLEVDGANRVSLVKMIDARLRKLVKPGENNRPTETAAA